MKREVIDQLISEVPMLRACRVNGKCTPNGVWFVFEAKPLPPPEQIKMVIADIDRNTDIHLSKDGMLKHSDACSVQSHKLDFNLEKAVRLIEPQTFHIAICEGKDSILHGQPVVISLAPQISYNIYPDHPHLNAAQNEHFIPDSICYTDNPKELGNDSYTRTLEAIQEACIWLFRHQVWLASRKYGKGIWIGPNINFGEEDQFWFCRNPEGECRCGSKKKYHQCHLNNDFKNAYNSIKNNNDNLSGFKNSDGTINIEKYFRWWVNNRFKQQNESMNRLIKALYRKM